MSSRFLWCVLPFPRPPFLRQLRFAQLAALVTATETVRTDSWSNAWTATTCRSTAMHMHGDNGETQRRRWRHHAIAVDTENGLELFRQIYSEKVKKCRLWQPIKKIWSGNYGGLFRKPVLVRSPLSRTQQKPVEKNFFYRPRKIENVKKLRSGSTPAVSPSASKQAYSIKTTWRNWKMEWDERWINSMKCSWFKVPVKVGQINAYLFSDSVQSQKTKSGSDKISQASKRTP